MTIRSRISLIMGLIGTEHLELFALELENCYFHFVYTLASTNVNQLAPNLITIYATQYLLRITFSFNDLMLKTNRLKKDFFL